MLFLKLYALIGVIVLARMLACMLIEFDEYDWRYASGETWFNAVLAGLLWPLFVFRPILLVRAKEWLTGGIGGGGTHASRDRLREKPPPCSSEIRYQPAPSIYGDSACGKFIFPARDVEAYLRNTLRQSPSQYAFDEGSLLSWVQNRDDSAIAPTDVPELWDRFRYAALALLEDGVGRAYCGECDSEYALSQLSTEEEHGQTASTAWSVTHTECPENHKLLSVEGTRALLAPDVD